jgi:hypothetical protein
MDAVIDQKVRSVEWVRSVGWKRGREGVECWLVSKMACVFVSVAEATKVWKRMDGWKRSFMTGTLL